MKIYTRTGDKGTTGLFGGERISKASERVSVYGDVDELNSVLGVVRAHGPDALLDDVLTRVQSELFDLGAELATPAAHQGKLSMLTLDDAQITWLEGRIDALTDGLPEQTTFVLPGGTLLAAQLHVARTVCRRAERALVGLAADEPVREVLVRYLNRLSDLLFVAARRANHLAGVPDVPWIGRDRA